MKVFTAELKKRLKLCFSDKAYLIVMLVCVVVFGVIVYYINSRSAESSRFPIGIVNEDKSETSNKLVLALKNNPSLSVYEEDFSDLKDRMEKGVLECIFVIEQGYEEKLSTLKTKGLITLYKSPGDKISGVISDIVAGEMMLDIMSEMSYNDYDARFEEAAIEGAELLSKEEYFQMISELKKDPKYKLAFNIHTVDVNEKGAAARGDSEIAYSVDASFVYEQVIICLMGLIISFISMTGAVTFISEARSGVGIRLKCLGRNRIAAFAGNCLGIFIQLSVFSFALAAIFEREKLLKALLVNFCFALFWEVLCVAIAYMAAFVFKREEAPGSKAYATYNCICIVMLLLSAGVCVAYIFEGIVFDSIPAFFHNTPGMKYLSLLSELK
ncbi:MAG: ABC transporter permease [Lachnospiraceae bacterium]|nr:ABC transporter permease [Lachnospiraceae bacterium]